MCMEATILNWPEVSAKAFTEILYLALTIYGEARGESYGAKVAVAWVIRNRVESPRYPDTYREVALQPGQFPCWTDHNREAMMRPFGPAWEECVEVAQKVVRTGGEWNPLPDVLHYHDRSVLPYWTKGATEVECGLTDVFRFWKDVR